MVDAIMGMLESDPELRTTHTHTRTHTLLHSHIHEYS